MKIRSQKDFFAGLMFMGIGTGFAVGANSYTIGEAARMGPGYFPFMLGILLTILGIAVVLQALRGEERGDGDKIGAWAWRPLGFIIGANVLFGVLLGGLPALGIPPMGLILAIYGLTFVSALAGQEFKFKEVAILGTVLAAGSYFAFVWALRLQFTVWPTFLTA